MRNLKRALSLAMASVMLLGMMVVGAGASYADVASEHNQEAIEVLQAVGIMTGDENGKFNPDQKVTRNEMAVIMCNLLDYTVASYKGTAPFTDVPAWAEPYVAACYTNGIIAGYSATTFGGSDSVTTGQGALMLMKALGYFQYQNDFGQDWLVATTSQGAKIDLFDGVDTGAREAMTRNDVARMVLNALEADVVDATGGGVIVEGNGISVNTGKATYDARTSTASKYAKISNTRVDGKYTVQLGEDLFGGDLEKKGSATDDFGRPSTEWKYKGDSIGTYSDGADNTLVINKSINGQVALVTDSDYFDYNTSDLADELSVYINGVKVTNATDYASLTNAALLAGDQVELFENDDDEIETIAVIRYTLAKIDEIETNLSNTYKNKGASVAISLVDLGDNGIGGTYYDKYDGDSSRELPGFAASTYEEDTVIAVAMNGNDILASHVAEAVPGVITAYNSGSKAKVTVGGTQYPMHAVVNTAQSGLSGIAMGSLSFNYNDSTYTAYLDMNGYIIGIDETESVKIDDVYYVAGIIKDQSRYTTYYAQAVSLTDGTVTEFKLDPDDTGFDGSTKVEDLSYSSNYATVQSLYTFDKDGSNYLAEAYNSASDSTYRVYAASGNVASGKATPVALTDDLARDDTRMTVGSRIYLNASTNYLKVEDDGADIDVKFVTGGTSVKQAGVTAIAVASKNSNNYVANYVILISNAFSNAGSDDVVFVHEKPGTTVSYTNADGDTKTGWSTDLYFLDGSGNVETVTVVGRKDAGFYTYEINDDGVYELESYTQTLASQLPATGGGSYDDETGYAGFTASNGDFAANSGIELTNIFNNALTTEALAGTTSGTNTLDDVDFASNVIIRDDRGKAARDASWYTSEITTVSQLKSAIDKNGGNGNADVKAVLYYDDGKVVMVYVLSVGTATGGGTPTPNAGYTLETAPTVTATTSGVNVTGAVIHYNNAVPSQAITGLTMRVVIEDRASGAWAEYDAKDVATTVNTSGNLTATAASVGLTAGTAYRITVTLSGGGLGTMELFSGTVTATAAP